MEEVKVERVAIYRGESIEVLPSIFMDFVYLSGTYIHTILGFLGSGSI